MTLHEAVRRGVYESDKQKINLISVLIKKMEYDLKTIVIEKQKEIDAQKRRLEFLEGRYRVGMLYETYFVDEQA